ncbi:MAG: hypothetical protein ACREQ5_28480 [Candidatus Dormibacteria bacterium]
MSGIVVRRWRLRRNRGAAVAHRVPLHVVHPARYRDPLGHLSGQPEARRHAAYLQQVQHAPHRQYLVPTAHHHAVSAIMAGRWAIGRIDKRILPNTRSTTKSHG